MKYIKLFLFILIFGLGLPSCSKNNEKSDVIKVTGKLEELGMTTFQYGTHRINSYVVKSEKIQLENYLNKTITISATIAKGYPIEGGPTLLIVDSIKE